ASRRWQARDRKDRVRAWGEPRAGSVDAADGSARLNTASRKGFRAGFGAHDQRVGVRTWAARAGSPVAPGRTDTADRARQPWPARSACWPGSWSADRFYRPTRAP